MATYGQIETYVRDHDGFKPKSCWIAHVKEINGLPVRVAHNRASNGKRKHPCPCRKRPAIEDAFRHFGMIKRGR